MNSCTPRFERHNFCCIVTTITKLQRNRNFFFHAAIHSRQSRSAQRHPNIKPSSPFYISGWYSGHSVIIYFLIFAIQLFSLVISISLKGKFFVRSVSNRNLISIDNLECKFFDLIKTVSNSFCKYNCFTIFLCSIIDSNFFPIAVAVSHYLISCNFEERYLSWILRFLM